ncbi:methyl-accepting chemotaxis protein [Crenobacter sp. SG2303]|uniref:Methyl-accepting chemotaxis protein n=1 Tax=Crenobacter oryzisoli TaxID=3056844 RepID=A0ABT7XMT2_9NEIS|nr:methyl-accepting chemotaxis protein [Crenobacter sp. SG2303]MDN0074874.1 methyl-accepting chemotaxis protein [Crenobacter sp. SG2303]
MMKTLRSRLISLTVLLTMLFGTAVLLFSYFHMRSEIRDGVSQEFHSILAGQGSVVKSWLEEKQAQISSQVKIAQRPDAVEYFKRAAEGGRFFDVYVAFADKRTTFASGWVPPADYDPNARPWFQQTKAAGKTIVVDPYIDLQSKKLTITVASPFNVDGTFAGVVGGDVFASDIMKAVLSQKVRGDGYPFIVNRDGLIIAHPKAELTLKPITDIAPSLTAGALNVLASQTVPSEAVIDGETMLVELQPIAGTNWYIGVAAKKSELMAPLSSLLYALLAISAVALVLIVAVTSIAIGRMLAGLNRLRDVMEDIAQGDGDLTLRLDDSGSDEIAATARAFNQFVGQLRKLFGQLQGEAHTLIGGVHQASSQLSSLADGSRQMAEVSSSNAATLEEITVSIAHVADSAGQVDLLVKGTHDELAQSATRMQNLSDAMEGTVTAVRSMESMLVSLDRRSQDISSITNVIRDIADQTNLLALNAAIEAARAGEQGRGFAVVADEVRKLAERTSQATLEIAQQVETIRRETGQAVGDVNLTVQSVDGGVEQTQLVVSDIETIRASMESVVTRMNDIAQSTTEQHNASTLIAQSTETINNRVQETDGRLQGVSGTLQALAEAASRMDAAFSRFKL